jgi:hypothetical protein
MGLGAFKGVNNNKPTMLSLLQNRRPNIGE